jgi:hypothetical protein
MAGMKTRAARFAALPRDQRRGARAEVRIAAELREAGSTMRFDIDVTDISIVGLRCETSFSLIPGHRVFLSLPSLGAVPCEVMWRDKFSYGLEFERPLHSAVLDYIARYHSKAETDA